MSATYFYFRKFKTSQFCRTKAPDALKDPPLVLIRTYALRNSMEIFCPKHHIWERAQDIQDFSATTLCGVQLHGLITQFVCDTTSKPEKLFSEVPAANLWNSLRINGKILKPVPDDFDTKSVYSESVYIPAIAFVPDRLRLLTEAAFEELFDELFVPREVFAYSLTVDEKNYSIFIKAFALDRKKLENRKFNFDQKIPYTTSQFYYDIKQGITRYFNTQIDKKDRNNSYTKYDVGITAKVSATAVFWIKKFILELTGCKMTLNTTITGEILLSLLNKFPLEPNLAILFRNLDENEFPQKQQFTEKNRLNPDCYNEFCKEYGIKSYRTLRKAFNENPLVLYVYKFLINDCGFKDTNIINQIILSIPKDFNCHFDREDLAFICRQCIREKSEKTAAKFITDYKDNNDFTDGLYMFHQYYTHIDWDTRDSIYRDGFNPFIHDQLSEIAMEAESENVTFSYSEKEMLLEDTISGYEFRLPEDSYKLVKIGTEMHNCVASYKNRILEKGCIVVYAVKDGEFRICIEIRGNTVWQQRSLFNTDLKGDDEKAMELYRTRHNLAFECNRF